MFISVRCLVKGIRLFLGGIRLCGGIRRFCGRGLAHYRLGKSLRPRLESGDFSSQILESQSSCENWACGLESQGGITKQADNKTTASEKSAESKKVDSSDNTFLSSLRADLSAWQSTQKSTTPLESTFSHNATQTHKADSKEKMDCHAVQAPLAMTEKKWILWNCRD